MSEENNELPTQTPEGRSRDELWSDIAESLERLKRWWEVNRETVLDVAAWALSSHHFSQKLTETGWLPHYTTPDLVFSHDEAATEADVARHYAENWSAVEAAFLDRLAGYSVDEEAKACFREALTAHRLGLYRVAPRLLFPEIERVCRVELGGAITVTSGLGWLREEAKQLGGDTFVRTGVLTLRLYQAFAEHIYTRVESPEQIALVSANPVPNRNAAIHGRVVYNTQKSSLNALIIAEFVLLTVGAVRDRSPVRQPDGPEVFDGDSKDAKPSFPAHVAGNRDWRRVIRAGETGSPSEGD